MAEVVGSPAHISTPRPYTGPVGGTALPTRVTPLLGAAGGLGMVAAGLLVGYALAGTGSAMAAQQQAAGVPMEPRRGPEPAAILGKRVEVRIGDARESLTYAELGVVADPTFVLAIDGAAATATLQAIKGRHDRAPSNAYLDLERRLIAPDTQGAGVDIFASLPRIEAAARAQAAAVELVTVPIPASVTKASLGIDDISHVLGTFTTKFAVTDRERNFNLKLAASKINGFVMKPGVEFSFNGTVGERSEKEGYKVAHVITAGEMVDGLAGGTCQISTTLFGAAFFAGLDVVKTTAHSRPSVYTPLGFDATVVWPLVDLKLANPYEFPVAIHYRVSAGEAVVEILGKKRPWDKIVFEREVLENEPFPSEERLDDTIPEGATVLDQAGFDGYKLMRYRRFYRGGKQVKVDKWTVQYRPVTEYIRRGTSLDPAAKMPKEKDLHGPTAPTNDKFKLAQ